MAEEEAQLNTTTDDQQREENQGKMMIQDQDDDDHHDASYIRDGGTNSCLLPRLNLALIISSLTPSQSQSHQEFQNLHKNPQGIGENEMLKTSHAKALKNNASLNIPRVRRQANHGIRGAEKQMMPNPNTKIRACRHGRKM